MGWSLYSSFFTWPFKALYIYYRAFYSTIHFFPSLMNPLESNLGFGILLQDTLETEARIRPLTFQSVDNALHLLSYSHPNINKVIQVNIVSQSEIEIFIQASYFIVVMCYSFAWTHLLKLEGFSPGPWHHFWFLYTGFSLRFWWSLWSDISLY